VNDLAADGRVKTGFAQVAFHFADGTAGLINHRGSGPTVFFTGALLRHVILGVCGRSGFTGGFPLSFRLVAALGRDHTVSVKPFNAAIGRFCQTGGFLGLPPEVHGRLDFLPARPGEGLVALGAGGLFGGRGLTKLRPDFRDIQVQQMLAFFDGLAFLDPNGGYAPGDFNGKVDLSSINLALDEFNRGLPQIPRETADQNQ
jgi:hypothetical protein